MTEVRPQERPHQFDLDALVEWGRTKNSRSSLVPALAGTGLGTLLVGGGIAIAFFHASRASLLDYGEGLVVAVLGVAIAAGSWIYVRALAQKPNLLIVTESFVSFGRREKPP